jgi:hypothetical protein
MTSQFRIRAGAVTLGIIACLGGAAAAPPAAAPASRAAEVAAEQNHLEAATQTHFENGEAMGGFFTALAVRFGVMVIQPDSLKVYILQSFDLPAKLGDALVVARQTLEPQGYSLVQKVSDGRLILRIVPTAEAKKILLEESPLSFGTQGEAIDVSDPTRPVAHIFPIAHADMADALKRQAGLDPDVSVEPMGGGAIGSHLILRGPASKVQRAVENLAKLDKPTEAPRVVRTLTLQHLSAETTADALNEVFSHEAAPMKAAADRRTNSLVVTGPEDRVLEVMVNVVSQEAKQGRLLSPPAKATSAPTPPVPSAVTTAPGKVSPN